MASSGNSRARSNAKAAAFWLGSLVVAAGVLLHLPMFWSMRTMGFMMAGMPMSAEMYWGMGLIAAGLALAAYGLLPVRTGFHQADEFDFVPPEDGRLSGRHLLLLVTLSIGLIIDIMKPASLGFVMPGVSAEYQIDKAQAALLPLSALTGTVVGSLVWGALADIYGRRAAILLSSVMFIGTSICGTMPGFEWNVLMCFFMGGAAGGMLPVVNALLAELMPTKHRGWSLVLVGGIGAVGGYLAASTASALLQPLFGWRVLWLLNLPTGLMLVALSPLIPESARFLMHVGRVAEARAVLGKFGAQATPTRSPRSSDLNLSSVVPKEGQAARTVTLTLSGLVWGLVNFGILLWLPTTLTAESASVGTASVILAKSALLSAPVVVACVFLYGWWSTKWSLVLTFAIMTVGLVALLLRHYGFAPVSNPILPVSLIVIGSSGVISIILPYAAENYPISVRGRATGWIAAATKFGGLFAQGLSVLALVPAIGLASAFIAISTGIATMLLSVFGAETRRRDLRDLEQSTQVPAGGADR